MAEEALFRCVDSLLSTDQEGTLRALKVLSQCLQGADTTSASTAADRIKEALRQRASSSDSLASFTTSRRSDKSSSDSALSSSRLSESDESTFSAQRLATDESTGATLLSQIRSRLKHVVPIQGVIEEEKSRLTYSQSGPNGECQEHNTIHVDAFLYPTADMERMMEEGVLPSHFCHTCGSRDIGELEVISHSMSQHQLQFLFQSMLPDDLEGMTLVDVGSRLGAVLFAAYEWTNCSNIVGVEISSGLCDIQQDVVRDFSLDKRIKIICDDVQNQRDLLHSADVVILNNVFEFFADSDKQKQLWQFVRDAVSRPGQLVVAVPSLAESLEAVFGEDEAGELLLPWVEEVDVEYPDWPETTDDNADHDETEYATEASSLTLYRVLDSATS